MPTKNPVKGRPGLSKAPTANIPLKKYAGRNLSVPTQFRGRPRVPRLPVVHKKNILDASRAARTIARRKAQQKVATKSVAKAAQVATRQVAGKVATKGATRFIPYIGWALLAYDAYQLINWAANYKDEAAKTGETFGLVPTLGEPPYEGGQGTTRYFITIKRKRWDGPLQFITLSSFYFGPLGTPSITDFTQACPNDSRALRIPTQTGIQPLTSGRYGQGYSKDGSCTPNGQEGLVGIAAVERVDGQPDTDGNLPGSATRNPIYDSATTVSPTQLPVPAAPLRSFPPATPAVSAPTSPATQPANQPKTPPVFQPGFEETPNTQPVAAPGSSKVDVSRPPQQTGTVRPTKPSSSSCEGQDTSPCSASIFEFLEYLDDKMDRPEEECPEAPEPPVLVQIDFPYVRCVEGSAEMFSGTFRYDPLTFPGLKPLLEEQATLAAKGCNQDDGIVAIPDSWQARRPREIPTMVLVFRKVENGAYHSFSVPHPTNTSPPTEPPVGEFRAGSYGAIINLSDNSRLVCNCDSTAESERVIAEFLALVDPAFGPDDGEVRHFKRRNAAVREGQMVPVRAFFYPDGNKTLKPVWRVSFTNRL